MGRAQLRFQWIPGPIAPGVQRPGCQADCSPPSSVKIKNEWSSTSTPPNAFMTCREATLLSGNSFNSPNKMELYNHLRTNKQAVWLSSWRAELCSAVLGGKSSGEGERAAVNPHTGGRLTKCRAHE